MKTESDFRSHISQLLEEEQASYFLSKAESEKQVEAMLYAATIYYYGLNGMKKDLQKAFELFSQAAKLGEARGIQHIADMYLFGLATHKVFN